MVQMRHYPSIWLEEVWNMTKPSVKIAHIWTEHLLVTSLDIVTCRGAWLLHGVLTGWSGFSDHLYSYTSLVTECSYIAIADLSTLQITVTQTTVFSICYSLHYLFPDNSSIAMQVRCSPHCCTENVVFLLSPVFISVGTCLLSRCLAMTSTLAALFRLSGVMSQYYLFGDTVLSGRYVPAFQRNLLPPSSGQNMGAAGSSETLEPVYQTTRRHLPADCDLNIQWYNNLECYKKKLLLRLLYLVRTLLYWNWPGAPTWLLSNTTCMLPAPCRDVLEYLNTMQSTQCVCKVPRYVSSALHIGKITEHISAVKYVYRTDCVPQRRENDADWRFS
jgi:hypothetical protein